MATTSSSRSSAERPGRRPGRRPAPRVEPARKKLLLAFGMVALGSLLPWIDTAVGTILGTRGAGLWTFYVSMLALTGAFVPWRRVAAVQAWIVALVAIALPVWQVVHMLDLVGLGGWMPGAGILLVFGGGVVAAGAAWRLTQPLPTS